MVRPRNSLSIDPPFDYRSEKRYTKQVHQKTSLAKFSNNNKNADTSLPLVIVNPKSGGRVDGRQNGARTGERPADKFWPVQRRIYPQTG